VAWDRVRASLEEVVRAAREDPAEAQALHDFLMYGCRTPQSTVLANLAELGIPTAHLSPSRVLLPDAAAGGADVRLAGLQRPGDPELLRSSRPRSAAEQIHARRGEENRILRGGFRTGHPHPSGGQAQNQRLVWMLEVRSWGWRLAGEHGHGDLSWSAAVVAAV